MDFTLIDVLLYAAAIWYVTHIVTSQRGPFGVFEKVRVKSGKKETSPLYCIICTVPYVTAVLIALYLVVPSVLEVVKYLFGFSGLALMLGSYTGAKHG